MKDTQLTFALAAVASLTLFSGICQGRLSHRWGASPDMRAAAQRLEEKPGGFGEWSLQSSSELEKNALDQLECEGHFVRTYVKNRTGEVVSATAIVGPAGPTSVHRPEICLSSRNYTCCGDRQRLSIQNPDGTTDQFWLVDFQSASVEGELLRVCYAWSTGTQWLAPDDARYAFAGSPYLYKVQISTVLRAGENVQKDTTVLQFLRAFVAEARKQMIAPPLD